MRKTYRLDSIADAGFALTLTSHRAATRLLDALNDAVNDAVKKILQIME